ncbi:hypothetical protein OIO90_004298 [Microbotryomycetes sp. JL221]|nr:hypothetical protein OIO90_004298 [Microbotryomycetes sp. JL221]
MSRQETAAAAVDLAANANAMDHRDDHDEQPTQPLDHGDEPEEDDEEDRDTTVTASGRRQRRPVRRPGMDEYIVESSGNSTNNPTTTNTTTTTTTTPANRVTSSPTKRQQSKQKHTQGTASSVTQPRQPGASPTKTVAPSLSSNANTKRRTNKSTTTATTTKATTSKRTPLSPPQSSTVAPPEPHSEPTSATVPQPELNPDGSLPLFLAPDYTDNPAGPASSESTSFRCAHCDKVYQGKHARSIWRRHLQDKHGIPLSQQPRRTRWDNDAGKKTEEERHTRLLDSKRQWARKSRAAKRADKSASVDPPEHQRDDDNNDEGFDDDVKDPLDREDDRDVKPSRRSTASTSTRRPNVSRLVQEDDEEEIDELDGDEDRDDESGLRADDSDYDEGGRLQRRPGGGGAGGRAGLARAGSVASSTGSRTKSTKNNKVSSSSAFAAPTAQTIYNRNSTRFKDEQHTGSTRQRSSSHQAVFASNLDMPAQQHANSYSQPRGTMYATGQPPPPMYYGDPYAVPHHHPHHPHHPHHYVVATGHNSYAAPLSVYPPPSAQDAEYYRHAPPSHHPHDIDARYLVARPSSTPATLPHPFAPAHSSTHQPQQINSTNNPNQNSNPSLLNFYDRRQASPVSHSRSRSSEFVNVNQQHQQNQSFQQQRSPVRAQFLSSTGLSSVHPQQQQQQTIYSNNLSGGGGGGGGGGPVYERAEDAANALIAMKVASPASSISHTRTNRGGEDEEEEDDDEEEVNEQLGLNVGNRSRRTSTQEDDDDDDDDDEQQQQQDEMRTTVLSPTSESSDLSGGSNRPWPHQQPFDHRHHEQHELDMTPGRTFRTTRDRSSSVTNELMSLNQTGSSNVNNVGLVTVSPRKRVASSSPDSTRQNSTTSTTNNTNKLLTSAKKVKPIQQGITRTTREDDVRGLMSFAQQASLMATPTPGSSHQMTFGLGGHVDSSPAARHVSDDDHEGDLTVRGVEEEEESAIDDDQEDQDNKEMRRIKRTNQRRSSQIDLSPSRQYRSNRTQYGGHNKPSLSSSSSTGRTTNMGVKDLLSSSATRYGTRRAGGGDEHLPLHHHHPVGLSSDLGGFNIASSSSSSTTNRRQQERSDPDDHSSTTTRKGHPSSNELMPPPHPSSSSILSTPAGPTDQQQQQQQFNHFNSKSFVVSQGMSRSTSNPIPFSSNNGNYNNNNPTTTSYANPISSPPGINYMFSSPAHPGISKQLGLASQPGPGFFGAAAAHAISGGLLHDDVGGSHQHQQQQQHHHVGTGGFNHSGLRSEMTLDSDLDVDQQPLSSSTSTRSTKLIKSGSDPIQLNSNLNQFTPKPSSSSSSMKNSFLDSSSSSTNRNVLMVENEKHQDDQDDEIDQDRNEEERLVSKKLNRNVNVGGTSVGVSGQRQRRWSIGTTSSMNGLHSEGIEEN